MARFESVPKAVLQSVAGQIGQKLVNLNLLEPTPPGAEPVATAETAESFAVWMMGKDALADPSIDLRRLAKPTGTWHHQIRKVTQPPPGSSAPANVSSPAFARSTPFGPEAVDWSVIGVFANEFAETIDRGIRWLEGNDHLFEGNPIVRLLVLPAFYTHAFWLINEGRESQVLPIELPSSFRILKPFQLNGSRCFLEALINEPLVEGIGERLAR